MSWLVLLKEELLKELILLLLRSLENTRAAGCQLGWALGLAQPVGWCWLVSRHGGRRTYRRAQPQGPGQWEGTVVL